MSVLLRYFKPYALYILLAIVLLFGQASCDLALPDLMSDIVNDGITTGNTSYIISTGFKMLGVALISASCTVTVGFLGARAAAGVCRGKIRRDIQRLKMLVQQVQTERVHGADGCTLQ